MSSHYIGGGSLSPPDIGVTRLATDLNQASILILFDLSAAFDTIDHDILIHHLVKWVGLSDNVLNWFQTHITGREFWCSPRDLSRSLAFFPIYASFR